MCDYCLMELEDQVTDVFVTDGGLFTNEMSALKCDSPQQIRQEDLQSSFTTEMCVCVSVLLSITTHTVLYVYTPYF